MSKFSTVALSVASVATVVIIGFAASATAATLPTITSSSGSSSSTTTSTTTSDTSSPPATTESTPATPTDTVTADIHVELGFVDDSGPITFEVTGIPVGDGPELTASDWVENPSGYECGDPTVDVSLNPTTITVTGGERGCYFEQAYVEVTLHGAQFSSTTVLSDNLFSPGEKELALGLDGGSYKARGVHFAATDPYPVLDSYGVSGNTFSAYWSGQAGSMDGAAVFSWVPVALAAPGAVAAASFTG